MPPDALPPESPTTAGRPILVCVVTICALTLIAITGLVTRTVTGDLLVVILGFIAGTGGIGAGAHLAAAERTRSALMLSTVIQHLAVKAQPAKELA